MRRKCGYRVPKLAADSAEYARAPVCVVLTAHPAKFEDACHKAGIPAATSPKVEALKKRAHSFEWLRAPPKGVDKLTAWAAAVKKAVETAARKSKGGVGAPMEAPRARL